MWRRAVGTARVGISLTRLASGPKMDFSGDSDMSMKMIGQVAIVLGVITVVLSLAANPLGIGSNPAEFGWLQTLGAVLGFLFIAAGLWIRQRK